MATAVRAFSSAGGRPRGPRRTRRLHYAGRFAGRRAPVREAAAADEERPGTTCRAPDSAVELQELRRERALRLTVLPLDVTDESTIEVVAATICKTHGSLDLLINATGILSIPNVTQPETSLSKVQKLSLLLAYEVNPGVLFYF